LWAGLSREKRRAGRGQLAVSLEVVSLRLETQQLPICRVRVRVRVRARARVRVRVRVRVN
jgi:hypothetical protein